MRNVLTPTNFSAEIMSTYRQSIQLVTEPPTSDFSAEIEHKTTLCTYQDCWILGGACITHLPITLRGRRLYVA